MSCTKRLLSFGLCASMAVMAATAFAQTEHPQTWAQDIAYLQQLAPADAAAQQSSILDIRSNVALWITAHPDSKIRLSPLPALPLTADQAEAQAKELDQAVTEIIKANPNRPFHLGSVEVNVNAPVSDLSPMADSIDQTEMIKRNELNVASALEYVPGVSLDQMYSGRNQVMAQIHGFGILQVPLYVDGIPVNDPYDGTLDFRQIATGNVAEIQVAKGFSSPLMGPNAVGGAINIITKEPEKKYEADLLIGGYSGYGLNSSLRLGSRMPHYFAQGSMDWQQYDFVPLSGNFVKTTTQPNYHLNNSDAQNARYTGRFGWTPRKADQYVFSYIQQRATSGIPLSPGNDPIPENGCYGNPTPSTSSPCYGRSAFRRWDYWEKKSFYFHSNTELGAKSSFKTRIYYDKYPNLMYFFNGYPLAYSNLMPNGGSIWVKTYDDHSDGFSTIFETRLVPRNNISASFFFKDDTHKEVPFPTHTSAVIADRQQTTSIGLQDVIRITPQLQATLGFSADHIDGMHASTWNVPMVSVEAYSAPLCPSNTNPSDFSACTPHIWAYNPQVSAAYTFHDTGRLFGGFAEKSRFASLSEMYSSKMNKGLQNPNLQPEKSYNWVAGYSRTFAGNTLAQVEYFLSDLDNAIESITIVDPGLALTPPTQYCPGSTNPSGVCSIDANASHETHQGTEFTLRSTPVKQLTVDASYTYLNKKIDAFKPTNYNLHYPGPCGSGGYLAFNNGATLSSVVDNSCLTATDVPRHKAVLSGTFHLPYDISAMALVRYESGTKAIDSFSVKSGSPSVTTYYYEVMRMSNFATVDMSATAPLFKGANVQAGVRNLLDRNYFYQLQLPEEGRNWFVNVRYKF
jgi:iron complex outermembrane receptor protein